jgi:beta-glucosidase-like glycosyl hydrolase
MPHENFMVMVSHLVYPAYEKVPASVSRVFMTNVLRKEWQYKGIIITDDMAMGGWPMFMLRKKWESWLLMQGQIFFCPAIRL